jgi:hypothetical protein
MKSIGFFLAVFAGMLSVFLVATGEIGRWLSSDGTTARLLPEEPGLDQRRENVFEFEYWDVKEGRRRFVVRAELSQETLQGSDPIDKLEKIALRDGIIELPLSVESRDGSKRPDELVLHFRSAIYHKGGDAVGGDSPLYVDLYDGRAESSEGTTFEFEDLHFVQRKEDRGKFEIFTDKPVRIHRSSQLEVRSRTGLRGLLSGDGGFEKLTFLPPVSSYFEPASFDLFGLPDAASRNSKIEPVKKASPDEKRVVLTCQDPLEIDFRAAPLHPRDDATRRDRMRISFRRDVKAFEVDSIPSESVPEPKESMFLCQLLDLDIDTRGRRLVPRFAVASWKGDRVRAVLVREKEKNVLHGETLVWTNQATLDESSTARSDSDPAIEGEAVLSGQPEFTGDDFTLAAERARIRPKDQRIFLERVVGELRRKKSATPRRTNPREEAATTGEPTANERLDVDLIEIVAESVEVEYQERDGERRSNAISRFTATGINPRGVSVRGKSSAEVTTNGEAVEVPPIYRADGYRLVYEEASREITLSGTQEVAPRLSFGSSWIESEEIHFHRDEQEAWFERKVLAHFEQQEAATPPAESTPTPEPRDTEFGGILELEAPRLRVRREGRKWRSALAEGTPEQPVIITAVPNSGGGDRYRFHAATATLDAVEKRVELSGGSDPNTAVRARITFDGGEVSGRKIVFDRASFTTRVEGDVQIAFQGKSEDSDGSRRVFADVADVVFYPGFKAPRSGENTVLARLGVIREFRIIGTEGRRVTVEAPFFFLRGEEATWDGERQTLRLVARDGTPEIELTHDQVRGPIRAREIEYDDRRHVVRLIGSVQGTLSQPSKTKHDASGVAVAHPVPWSIRTSELDVQLRPVGPKRLELVELRARQTVDIENVEKGLKLLGDELVYDHAESRIRVFSEDGRLQTLLRSPKAPGSIEVDSTNAAAAAGPAPDKVLAREIVVYLVEELSPNASVREALLIELIDEVIANFRLEESRSATTLGVDSEVWKVECQRMVFDVDPESDAGSASSLRSAIAEGRVVASSPSFRAQAERAEFRSADESLRFEGGPRGKATVVDLQRKTDIEKNVPLEFPVIVVRRRAGRTIFEFPAAASTPVGGTPRS